MFNFKKALLSAGVVFLFLSLFAVVANAEGNGVGIVKGDGVNLRRSASTSSEVIDQLSKGTQVSILGSSGGWYKISKGGLTGWINGDFITVKEVSSKQATIVAGDVNLRSEPSTDALVLTTLDKGDKVSVYSCSGNWYKVKTSNGKVGWIFTDFISMPNSSRSIVESAEEVTKKASKTEKKETPKKQEAPSTGAQADEQKDTSTFGQKLVAKAKKYLGVKYVYGGSSPSGFDCSGFTKYVYDSMGVNLERVAADQAQHGTKVSKANLKPGDLVFFDTNGGHNYINHAGIYIGNGQFIHASSGRSSHKVVISDLSEGFYQNAYMTARRMVK